MDGTHLRAIFRNDADNAKSGYAMSGKFILGKEYQISLPYHKPPHFTMTDVKMENGVTEPTFFERFDVIEGAANGWDSP